MTDGEPREVLQPVGTLMESRVSVGQGNDELLRRFVKDNDEAAFEAIVQRHGPMVLAVCRRVLSDGHDAEDAFQATFFILARRASAIRNPAALGAWLHSVAVQVSTRARKARCRRDRWQVLTEHEVGRNDPADVEMRELKPVLDEEVERLPEKYRSPVVLCYLEGLSNTEAAEQLGWPVGTVKGRLARARSLLQGRLARRGVALGATLVALSGGLGQATAAVPPTLGATVTSQAVGVAAGAAPASPAVAALFHSGLNAMALGKLKMMAAVLACACGLGGIGTYLALTWRAIPAVPEQGHTAPVAENGQRASDREARTRPVGVPLVARLIGMRQAHVLDLGGLTADEFRRQVEQIAGAVRRPGLGGPQLPASPEVGLKLELTNTGKEELRVEVGGSQNQLSVDLQGPGAFYAPPMVAGIAPIQRPSSVLTIAPGATVIAADVPNLAFPKPGVGTRAYWTAPGDYRLAVEYVVGVSPPPDKTEPFGEGFGTVTVRTAPVLLKVIAAK